jgi:hypothetical protein
MKRKLYTFSELEIWQEDDRFYMIYDAGSHQVVMRKDEISEDEAELACTGLPKLSEVMFTLQKRLIESGIEPYKSNWSPEKTEK